MTQFAALVPLLASSLFGFGASVHGSGKVIHESREVPAFHAVQVASGIHAELLVGPLKPLDVSGDDNILPLVRTEVVDGELRIGFQSNTSIESTGDITVRITAPALDSIGASGGSVASGQVGAGDELSAEASGGGKVALTGVEAGALDGKASGGATLHFEGKARRFELELSGGASIRVLGKARTQVSTSGGSSVASGDN